MDSTHSRPCRCVDNILVVDAGVWIEPSLVHAGARIVPSSMPVHGWYPRPCRCMDIILVPAGAWRVTSSMLRCIDSTLIHAGAWIVPAVFSVSTIVAAFPFFRCRQRVRFRLFFSRRSTAPAFCSVSPRPLTSFSAPPRRVCVVFRSVLSRHVGAMFRLCYVPPRSNLLNIGKTFLL